MWLDEDKDGRIHASDMCLRITNAHAAEVHAKYCAESLSYLVITRRRANHCFAENSSLQQTLNMIGCEVPANQQCERSYSIRTLRDVTREPGRKVAGQAFQTATRHEYFTCYT